MVTASGTPSGLQTLLMFLQTKPILQNKFVKMPRSFILRKIFCMCPYKFKLNFEEKVPGKVGECIFDS